MSANLDVAAAPLAPPPTMGEATPSVAQEESSPNAGHDTAGKIAEAGQEPSGSLANSDSVPDYLKDFPSTDELEQNKSERYAQALLSIRPAHDALLEKHRTTTQRFEPWQPFVEKYNDPATVQSKLDIVDGFFAPVLDEQGQQQYNPNTNLPLTTARPGLEKLAAESTDTVYQITNDLLALSVDGIPMAEQVFNHLCKLKGLNPQNVQQYQEWERTGAPVANQVDPSIIPEQFRAAFQQLPAVKQRVLSNLLASDDPEHQEEARYDLRQAQERFADQQSKAQAREADLREQHATIERTAKATIQGKLDTGVDQFLAHLSTWKPTADDGVNKAYHLETASSLLNLLDPGMARVNNMLYETLGMQPDAEIPKLNQQFQEQTTLVEYYKVRKETLLAAQAQGNADSAFIRLQAKLNGVAGKLIEHKSRVAKVAESAEAASGQQGRLHIPGQPAASTNGRSGGDWKAAWYD